VCAVDFLDRLTGPTCEGPDAANVVRLPHTRNAPGKTGRPPPARPSWTARASRPPTGGPHSYDGAKRLQRRKRHLLVDTLGLVCKVQVTAADVGDRSPFLDWTRQLRGIASRSCSTTTADTSRAGCRRVPRHPIVSSFAVVPRRWVVEWTFAWLGRFGWLSKDHKIGRISRLLWRSLKAASRGRAPIWRGAVTVTEPIGTALIRLGLRKFVE
jgi:transposase